MIKKIIFIGLFTLLFMAYSNAETLKVYRDFEDTVEPGYSISIISPEENQRFNPSDTIEVEVITWGSPPVKMIGVMVGSISGIIRGSAGKIKLKLDEKYTGESEVVVSAHTPYEFIGSKTVKIFIGNKDSTEGVRWQDTRKPNDFEYAYVQIAQDIKSPQTCYKISPRASSSALFSPAGHQIKYLRSECFFAVATTIRDKNLCEEVKTISNPWLDGSAISKNNCMRAVDRYDNPYASISLGFIDEEAVLNKMGYNASNTLENYHKENGSIDYVRFYLDVMRTENFKERLKYLPDFSKE